MPNILSQDEVDSLLEGITKGKVDTETDVSDISESIEVYDFSMPHCPVNLSLPTLKSINEKLADLLKKDLQALSRAVIDVNLVSTDSVKFNDFCLSISIPSILNIFSIAPLKGDSLVVLENSMVFSFLESLFGGKGERNVKYEGRCFTAIETKIVEKVVKIILGDLQKAWSDIYEVNPVFIRSEMAPQFLGIETPDELMVVFKFEVKLESGSGFINICMPFSSIKPISETLKNNFRSQKVEVDTTWKKYIQKKLLETTVELKCILGKATLKGGELLNLKIDDIILLDQKMGNTVTIKVEDIPKYRGYAGTCNKKKAVKIIEKI